MGRGLTGEVVLITGAARGIGEHTARLAAARGARLALVGLEPERLAALRAELGPDHVWFGADVTDQAALTAAVRGTLAAFGRLDAVVANAGVANRGTVAAGDVEAQVRTVEVNLIGVMRTAAATAPALIASRGYLLLVSSAAAFAALPGMAAYCASKAGVEQFGNAIRLELAHHGVRVGTAHPSWVDTDLVRDAREDLPSFRAALDRLPWPVGSTTSVTACAEAMVDAVERRRRRVYVPRAVGLVQAARTLVLSPVSDLVLGRGARRSVPVLEEQVRALGRSFGRHTAAREGTPAPAPVPAPRPGAAQSADARPEGA
ncbi:short-chain dehydrogenase/reductase [Micromonospora sp. NPDC049559]|uniref:short-chain dehydrogenase/reductase n=1 Tax=Micromonospora sp. NPDC049559 TaxID=3155923 RepID=UPI00344AEBAD